MEQNGIKNVKNGDLGAAKFGDSRSFFFEWGEGGEEEFLVQKPSSFPPFTHFMQGLLAQAS